MIPININSFRIAGATARLSWK